MNSSLVKQQPQDVVASVNRHMTTVSGW